jgi:hypothetical protein
MGDKLFLTDPHLMTPGLMPSSLLILWSIIARTACKSTARIPVSQPRRKDLGFSFFNHSFIQTIRFRAFEKVVS